MQCSKKKPSGSNRTAQIKLKVSQIMKLQKDRQTRKSTINIIKPNRADPNLYGQISLRMRVVVLDRLNKQAAKQEITLGEYISAILEQAAKEGK